MCWVADGLQEKGWAWPAVDRLVKPIDDRGAALVRSVDVIRIGRTVLVMMTVLPLIVAFGMRHGPPSWPMANACLTEDVADFTSVGAVAWAAWRSGGSGWLPASRRSPSPPGAAATRDRRGGDPVHRVAGTGERRPGGHRHVGVVITAVMSLMLAASMLMTDPPEQADSVKEPTA